MTPDAGSIIGVDNVTDHVRSSAASVAAAAAD